MPGKTSPSSGLQIQLPQASGKRREFDLKEGKFVCHLNYENRGGERWIRTRGISRRIYAPLTAGLLSAVRADAKLRSQDRSLLDRLYQRVVDDLDALIQTVGLKAA
jgi:hypothetical protein